MESMRLILIRHGETKWSKENRYLGRVNISLNKEGIKQAKIIAQRLKDEGVRLVYSSMTRRAVDTASIIAQECGAPLIKDARLNELAFGDWEGLKIGEIEKKTPDVWERWQKELETYHPPKGESIVELKDRVISFLNWLIATKKNQTVAVVSHGGPIKIILLHAIGAPLESFWRLKQELGALNIVEYYDNCPLVVSINDVSHLR